MKPGRKMEKAEELPIAFSGVAREAREVTRSPW